MHSLSDRQQYAALVLAMAAPIAFWLPSLPYLSVAAAALFGMAFFLLLERLRRKNALPYGVLCLQVCGKGWGRLLLAVSALWLLLAAGRTAEACERIYDGARAIPVISLLTWAAAVWAAGQGERALLRALCVAFLFCTAIFAAVLVFSLPDLTLRFLRPRFSWRGLGAALPSFLLASLLVYFPQGVRRHSPLGWSIAVAAFAVLASAVTAGSISPEVAASDAFPFGVMTKSLSLFGVMERFEAVVSAAVNAAYFALLALFAAAVRRLVLTMAPACPPKAVQWGQFFTGGALVLAGNWLPQSVYLLGAAIFWGVLPLVLLSVGKEKNGAKSEKILDKRENI